MRTARRLSFQAVALMFFASAGFAQTCGVASLLDVCQLVARDLSNRQRQEMIEAYPAEESSMLDIKHAAVSLGLHLVGVKTTLDELKSDVRGPKIIHLQDPDHFLVLARVSEDWVQLLDGGRTTIAPRSETEKRFSGHALIFEQSESDAGGPRLQLDEFHYPFGIVGVGQKVQHTFQVRNAGDQDLVLALQSSGCSGLPSSIGKETLAPGESTDLTVDLTVSYSGSFVRSAKLVTNDLTQPVAFITVHGKVPHDLRAYPDRVVLVREKGDTPAATITVNGPAEMDMTEATCEKGLLDVQVGQPQVSEDEKKTWRVIVALKKPDTLLGECSDELSIKTTHRDRPLITVPIKCTVRGDLAVSPPSAFFGFVRRGEQPTANISIRSRSGTPFSLLNIAPSAPRIKVRPTKTDACYTLTVSVATDKSAVFEGEVAVTTDVPLEETITIPVYAHVVE